MRIVAGVILLAGTAACAAVLGLNTSTNHPFEHRAHVLRGIACTNCHEGIYEADDDGPLHLPGDDQCRSCHAAAHSTESCTGCHGLDATPLRVGMAKHYLRFAHREHLGLVNSNCMRCHQDAARSNATLLPKMATCLGCHPHRDTFNVADCDRCHVNLEVEQTRPVSHLVHEEDYAHRHGQDAAANRFLCDTCHSEEECASCHAVNVPVLAARKAFDRPRLAGLHRAGFRSRHGREARIDPGLCITCHSEETCRQCHSESGLSASGDPGRNPHPPGWVGITASSNRHGIEARRDPVSCAGCHSGAGEALCVDCHRVGGVGGTVHPPGWTSRLSKTRDAPCRLCHGPSQ